MSLFNYRDTIQSTGHHNIQTQKQFLVTGNLNAFVVSYYIIVYFFTVQHSIQQYDKTNQHMHWHLPIFAYDRLWPQPVVPIQNVLHIIEVVIEF